MKRFVAHVVGVTSLHLIVQFFAWSVAPGNTARPEAAIYCLWPIVSFPTFYVAPSSVATAMFWPLCLLNSAIWGMSTVMVATALRGRGRRREHAP